MKRYDGIQLFGVDTNLVECEGGEYVRHADVVEMAKDAVQDVKRLEFLQANCLAADFDYGERHECVLVFRWPKTPIGWHLRKTIDAAMEGK